MLSQTSIVFWSLPVPYWSKAQKLSDRLHWWNESRPALNNVWRAHSVFTGVSVLSFGLELRVDIVNHCWIERNLRLLLLLILYAEEFIVTEVMLWSQKKKTALFWLSKANDGLTLSLKDINSLREALRSVFITKNTKGLVISENHRQRPRWYKFEFSFVGNDRQPSQKSGMRRGKDLFPTIPDDRRYLRFRVFVSGQNLGRSGNSKIHERLEFSRHINIRFKQAKKS